MGQRPKAIKDKTLGLCPKPRFFICGVPPRTPAGTQSLHPGEIPLREISGEK